MITHTTARPSRAKLAAVAVAVLALTVSACGKDNGSGGDAAKLDGITLVHPGKLTTCTHLSYKPFEYKEGAKVVGFDVDLLDLLAKDLGVEQEVISIEWAQVTSGAAYQAKKCDMGMGAMTITPSRQAAIAISEPYMDASQVLLVKKGAPYKSLADLKGKKVGVQADTTGKDYATAAAKKDGFEVVVFNDLALQTNSVKSGRVDAAINDNGALYNFVTANPDTEVATEFDTGEKYGFAAKKGDPSGEKLISKFNELLTKAKSDGTYNTIYKKWFGIEPKK
ncbi:amino acid ABC transporter substrate-binding protein (PAAT family) [Kribbella voronezhensis]|uniref:Amino acid ABC transporter substrate-binding protein (PAAT family) n=1 Tax=Kribbella voronezhensis TaxID=2512212 RepID=A0A4R7TIP2_9ACTN|nr:ABC transporter substrate-binding protein [Kribbella voronezhensis]TDU91829.1 amino acid ABC transporter substrate-binding protein (PAAT family) [Kribbella voronezhensis]